MRFLRITIFSFINIILFIMFKKNYDIIYYYFFGETVFIPVLPALYLYLPILAFQVVYQLILTYELLFKKFITKKLNIFFAFPILLILITLNKSPYDNFEGYQLPNFKIQELMFRIQTNLEEYRVETKYYPKTKDRFFNKIIKNINKDFIITDYTNKTKKQKVKFIYKFDELSAYTKNIDNYKAPAIIVTVDSVAKHYWITAIIKNSYINGKNIVLNYNGNPFILKEEIMIRDRLRNKDKKEYIYNELIDSLKK